LIAFISTDSASWSCSSFMNSFNRLITFISRQLIPLVDRFHLCWMSSSRSSFLNCFIAFILLLSLIRFIFPELVHRVHLSSTHRPDGSQPSQRWSWVLV
jgi:hypothetical protein